MSRSVAPSAGRDVRCMTILLSDPVFDSPIAGSSAISSGRALSVPRQAAGPGDLLTRHTSAVTSRTLTASCAAARLSHIPPAHNPAERIGSGFRRLPCRTLSRDCCGRRHLETTSRPQFSATIVKPSLRSRDAVPSPGISRAAARADPCSRRSAPSAPSRSGHRWPG